MKEIIAGVALAAFSLLAHALQPYVAGDKVAGGDVRAAMAAAEQKLTAAGFTVIGRHNPQGLPQHASIVVTEPGFSAAMTQIGGSAVVGLPIRVGVKADGTVSYQNLEYWQRAYLRANYGKAEAAVKATSGKLQQALGAGKPFGGDVKPEDLPTYRYMAGMERFDDKSELKTHATKKIGPDHVAALPWEVFVIDNKAYSLFARYRTALAWPDLGMFQFMGIGSHPDSNQGMMAKVAGGAYEGKTQ